MTQYRTVQLVYLSNTKQIQNYFLNFSNTHFYHGVLFFAVSLPWHTVVTFMRLPDFHILNYLITGALFNNRWISEHCKCQFDMVTNVLHYIAHSMWRYCEVPTSLYTTSTGWSSTKLHVESVKTAVKLEEWKLRAHRPLPGSSSQMDYSCIIQCLSFQSLIQLV